MRSETGDQSQVSQLECLKEDRTAREAEKKGVDQEETVSRWTMPT